jgi:hypothetical protein
MCIATLASPNSTSAKNSIYPKQRDIHRTIEQWTLTIDNRDKHDKPTCLWISLETDTISSISCCLKQIKVESEREKFLSQPITDKIKVMLGRETTDKPMAVSDDG